MRRTLLLLAAALALAACQPRGETKDEVRAPAAPTPAVAAAPAPVVMETPVPPEFAGDLDARGTEPFWAIRIRKDGLTLERPGQPPLTLANPGPAMSGDAAVWVAGPFTLTLREAACSDGMSDTGYPMTAQAAVAGEALSGCALPAG